MKKRMLVASIAGGVLATGIIAAVILPGAGASSSINSSVASPTSFTANVAKTEHHKKTGTPFKMRELRWAKGIAKRAVAATITVKAKDHSFKTIDIYRGSITSISPASITLSDPDGQTITATITSSTKFLGRKEAEIADGFKAVLVTSSGSADLIWSHPVHAKKPATSTSPSTSSSLGSSTSSSTGGLAA